MKTGNKSRGKQRLWRGLTTLTASVLALAVAGSSIVNGFRTDIDKFLGTTSSKVVTEDAEISDIYTYSSDYASTTELVNAIADVSERMSEEGTVLLKNNGALPLSADEKGKIATTRIDDNFMEQLLHNDANLLKKYNAISSKHNRQAAANVLPILMEKGLVKTNALN